MTKYGIKYFSRAVGSLAYRGQIHFQITMGVYWRKVGKITSLQNSLQPRDIVAYEAYRQRVIAFCHASNSLTLRGQPRSTTENRDTSDFAQTLENVALMNTKQSMKYFARAVSRLTARGQNDIHLTWAPTGEGSGKSRPLRF